MNFKDKSDRKTIIFIDSGDTIIDESTQVFAPGTDTVLSADFIPGAEQAIRSLSGSGHTLALVADGRIRSFENVYRKNGLYPCFSAQIYSEALGVKKPHAGMFLAAVSALGLTEADYPRIIMVGNNLACDIKGANDFGITSVYLSWTPRYPKIPAEKSQVPDYTIGSPMELVPLVKRLDRMLLSPRRRPVKPR